MGVMYKEVLTMSENAKSKKGKKRLNNVTTVVFLIPRKYSALEIFNLSINDTKVVIIAKPKSNTSTRPVMSYQLWGCCLYTYLAARAKRKDNAAREYTHTCKRPLCL
ncbi:protein of unknown function [Paenibacillus alvei]|uniref:Uncharacterized protein n=1 Tax=Paenibacillus alvei TaxID=44250 RepID=A0A383RIQ1_PAEAL|nr:protein of unknown function [Paenibacillus alvei]